MNEQKNQENGASTLLDGIQKEVSPESTPLLNFITRYASAIAGIVLLLLLILGGWAIWNWYHTGKQEEARKELARINMELKGRDREAALDNLAKNAPDSVKLFIYMSLAQSAQENGNPVLAADAYARAAKLDGDGPIGLAAALGSVGSLLMQSEYVQALALLQELLVKLPEAAKSVELRQMLATAAEKAGKPELALKTWRELAEEINTPEKAYFQSRANELARQMQSGANQQ